MDWKKKFQSIGCPSLDGQTESWSILKYIQPMIRTFNDIFIDLWDQNIYDFDKLPHESSFKVGYLYNFK
ncbi:MAG: hypothetical protein ABF652_03195 [Clostridium beijerinckii]